MEIQLENIGKRYGRHWIFRGISHTYNAHTSSSIVGANGSGKSTLVKILSGFLSPTEGEIRFSIQGQPLSAEDVFRHVSFCAPYVKVPGDLKLIELLDFHSKLKPLACSNDDFMEITQLSAHGHKQVRNFSSGMQQRVRLALALLSDVSLVVLDEPSSNLDKNGIAWFQNLLAKHGANKTVIIGSNHNQDEILSSKISVDLGTGAIAE